MDPGDDLARRYNAMTAYGALVQGQAAGEGFAMAVKVLCDALGLECHVVRGALDGRQHTWNMLRLDGGPHYHLDPTAYDGEGAAFLNDSEIAEAGYAWDTALYPPCDGPSLRAPSEGSTEPSNLTFSLTYFTTASAFSRCVSPRSPGRIASRRDRRVLPRLSTVEVA